MYVNKLEVSQQNKSFVPILLYLDTYYEPWCMYESK